MSGTQSKLDELIRSADAVVSRCGGLRVNGKVASERTQTYSRELIRECCRRLHRLGFYLISIEGLQRKHIDALVGDWAACKLSAKTIQNQFSRLKIFCGWLSKAGIVSPLGAIGHLPGVDAQTLRVRTVAEKSKSWSENGVDITEKLSQARMNDQRHGAMLLLSVAFGLRKKEQLRIKPWKADKGSHLEIDGSVAKNGKFRSIRLEGIEGGHQGATSEQNDFGRAQRWALDEAKKLCKKNETLGWPELSFKQSENRYYHFMKVLGLTKFDAGVTGHGLRAEYAENMLVLRGLMPPTLGGTAEQLTREVRDTIMQDVQNTLGHNDRHVAGAYWGSFRRDPSFKHLGARIGAVLLVDQASDTFAMLYCSPSPSQLEDGTFKVMTASQRKMTQVTAVVEKAGCENEMVDVDEFVLRYPALAGKVQSQLIAVGLGTGQ